MAFNSLEFLIFFTVVFIAYALANFTIKNTNIKLLISQILIFISSIIFYGYLDYNFIPLLFGVILITFIAGSILKKHKSKIVCTVFIILVLLPLFYFKKLFLTTSVFIPIGLSFYTLQSITYIVSVFKGELKNYDLLTVSNFVSFFPVISSGPIQRAKNFIPQLEKQYEFDYEKTVSAMILIAIGLIKKIVIADNIANLTNFVYQSPDYFSATLVLCVIFLYSFQILCDFSGYTDIARGCSKMLGFDIGKNFENPYLSKSATEFWHRWHISLTSWFKDYIYIPMGGNRVSKIRTYFNIMTVFILSGLWHGLGLNFLIWGFLHGIWLCVEKMFKNIIKITPNLITKIIQIIFTFSIVSFLWVIFRIDNINQIKAIFLKLAQLPLEITSKQNLFYNISFQDFILICTYLFIFIIIGVITRKSDIVRSIRNLPTIARWGIYITIIFALFFLSAKNVSTQFIYSRF